jgi:hypothetical protein
MHQWLPQLEQLPEEQEPHWLLPPRLEPALKALTTDNKRLTESEPQDWQVVCASACEKDRSNSKFLPQSRH